MLRHTVDDLLEWDFSQPLADSDVDYLHGLFVELSIVTDLYFYGDVGHSEWINRLDDIQRYIRSYVNDKSLSEEDVADLHQALRANLYITMDFNEYVKDSSDFYEAMNDEQHEMAEIVKRRLDAQY